MAETIYPQNHGSTLWISWGYSIAGLMDACFAVGDEEIGRFFTQSAVPKALRFLPLIGITSLAIGAVLLFVIVGGSAA